MKRVVVTLLLAAFAGAASAQSGDMKGMDMKMDHGAKKAEARSHHATGVVKSVSTEKGTVTVAHEAVNSMNWPAMTMSFKAKDGKALQNVKPGQKIEFDFVQQGKDYVITRIK